jgi:hypothetical protein
MLLEIIFAKRNEVAYLGSGDGQLSGSTRKLIPLPLSTSKQAYFFLTLLIHETLHCWSTGCLGRYCFRRRLTAAATFS